MRSACYQCLSNNRMLVLILSRSLSLKCIAIEMSTRKEKWIADKLRKEKWTSDNFCFGARARGSMFTLPRVVPFPTNHLVRPMPHLRRL